MATKTWISKLKPRCWLLKWAGTRLVSNVSWCLIKTDSGFAYGVCCWPGASAWVGANYTHPGTWGAVVTTRVWVSSNIIQHHEALESVESVKSQSWEMRHVRTGPLRGKLWGWHFMTTETLGPGHKSHVTCSRVLRVPTCHQWPQWPGPGCLGKRNFVPPHNLT